MLEHQIREEHAELLNLFARIWLLQSLNAFVKVCSMDESGYKVMITKRKCKNDYVSRVIKR